MSLGNVGLHLDFTLSDCTGVSNPKPDLHMINMVVGDMAASLDFYRRLGIVVSEGEDSAEAHVELRMPGGMSLELDTADSARLWHAASRTDPTSVGVVIGFTLPTREGVDERYAELTSSAIWGGNHHSTPSGALDTRLWRIQMATMLD